MGEIVFDKRYWCIVVRWWVVYVVVVHCVMLSRGGGCCELKKARGGLNSLCSGGGYMIKRVWV